MNFSSPISSPSALLFLLLLFSPSAPKCWREDCMVCALGETQTNHPSVHLFTLQSLCSRRAAGVISVTRVPPCPLSPQLPAEREEGRWRGGEEKSVYGS